MRPDPRRVWKRSLKHVIDEELRKPGDYVDLYSKQEPYIRRVCLNLGIVVEMVGRREPIYHRGQRAGERRVTRVTFIRRAFWIADQYGRVNLTVRSSYDPA